MGTVVHLNGRIHYASPSTRAEMRRPKAHLALARTPRGHPVDPQPIPPDPKAPTAGQLAYDVAEDIPYTILRHVDPMQGWASSGFWQARWNVTHREVILFAQAGWLFAAAEEGSLFRTYKCKDETALKASEVWKKAKTRIQQQRARETKALVPNTTYVRGKDTKKVNK